MGSPLANRPIEGGELRGRDRDPRQLDAAGQSAVDYELAALLDAVIGDDLLDNARREVGQGLVNGAVSRWPAVDDAVGRGQVGSDSVRRISLGRAEPLPNLGDDVRTDKLTKPTPASGGVALL